MVAPAIGGPIKQLSVDGRIYTTAGDGDSPRDLGGNTNTFAPNGDGKTGRWMQTPRGWKVDSVVIACNDNRNDQKALQDVADSGVDVPINFTYSGNITFGGKGNIEGEITWSNNNTTATCSFVGPGRLRKQ